MNRLITILMKKLKFEKKKNLKTELNEALRFIKNDPFGIELDLDAIPGVYSSAMTN